MKIIHLASEYPPQKVFGLGRFVHDLAIEQVRRGHEVHVVTNSIGGRDHEIVEKGVHVHRVDAPPPPKPADSGATVTQFNVQLLERVFRDRICPDADVVNAHDWLTALAGKTVARRLGAIFVVTIHDAIVGKRFGELDNEAKYVGNIEHWVCHEADRVICVSEHTRNEVIESYGADPNKTYAIHNAVSEDSFPVPDPKLLARFRRVLAREDEKIVLYVGRLDHEKGVDVLLDAFAEVQRGGHRAKLVIAGKGVLEPELRKKAVELGVERGVVFTGYAAGDVLNYAYHSADVLVVPSLYEPFGIVALEGMICGLPVVASATGGLTEIIQSEANGLTTIPGDGRNLAEQISRVLSDGMLAGCLADAGRRTAREKFSWAHVLSCIEGVLLDPDTPPAQENVVAGVGRMSAGGGLSRCRVLFDCTPIHEGMTGIGLYAESVLSRLPAAWPEAEWVLLASPRNTRYLGERFTHQQAVVGEEFELRFPARQRAIGDLARRVEANLYFGPMYDAPEGNGTRSVTMIHDLAFLRFPGMLSGPLTEYTTRAAEHAARRSGTLISVSESVREEIIAQYGLPSERVVVAHPGVAPLFEERPSADELEHVVDKYAIGSPYVLAVNLTNSRKNASRLFEAFRTLISRRPPPLTLVLAGGWSISGANLWRMAYDAGIYENVAVTGYVARRELLCLYAGAKVMCMPSLYEGFGMPLIEAMACGVPVVTSDRGAMREVTGGCAILVDPEDATSIAAGIRNALDDAQLRETCIRRGLERVKEFTWDRAVEQIGNVLQSLART